MPMANEDPLGGDPFDAEITSHHLTSLAMARRQGAQPDRPGKRGDMAEGVERMPVGPRDPPGTEDPDANRVVHPCALACQAGTGDGDPIVSRMRSGSARTWRIVSA
jgi:hypothetical protein